jgi:hypothetical protein
MAQLITTILVLLAVSLDAYRVGDAVDTIVRTDASAEDALRSQMPLFGKTSSALFSGATPKRFSLSFEEGLRPIPWVETADSKGQTLERLDVTFVYSRSGEGAIYGISSEPKYGSSADTFLVQYNWVEEEEVNPRAASAVMFAVVFLASVVMLISSCGVSLDEDATKREDQTGNPVSYGGYDQPSGVPKWD